MNQSNTNIQENVMQQTKKDLMVSIMTVSVVANLTIFVTWLVITADSRISLLLVTH